MAFILKKLILKFKENQINKYIYVTSLKNYKKIKKKSCYPTKNMH
jgi:hypothetical protein